MKTNEALSVSDIRGGKGFRFDFKIRNGVLYFIRYKDGEREFARSNSVVFSLWEGFEVESRLRAAMSIFSGFNKSVLNAALHLIRLYYETKS